MFEIRQKRTGQVLHSLPDDSLYEAALSRMDLRGADLYGLDFRKADFAGADLSDADLKDCAFDTCKLTGANFTTADIQRACFTESNMYKSQLRWADLRYSSFRGVLLREADMQCSDLRGAVFYDVDLDQVRLDETCLRGTTFVNCNFRGANLTKAAFGNTVLCRCINLHEARGLLGTGHLGPSSPDLQTLRSSIHALPDEFLLELGLAPVEIARLRESYETERPGKCGSSFIVYAQQEQKFAEYLCRALRNQGLQAWLCRSQTGSGTRIWPWDVNDMLRSHDKIIVICSRNSLTSKTVAHVSEQAIARERVARIQKLFAVRVDASTLSDEVLEIAGQKTPHGEFKTNWMHYLLSYMVADFTSWTNPAVFKNELERLTKALSSPSRR